MITPAAATAAIGSFLLILRTCAGEFSPSVSSNQSGFFGVIVDPFR